MAKHQTLPATGPEREKLREKGQFWTPDWVADAMCAYALAAGAESVLDPAVGAGAFLLAGAREAERRGTKAAMHGCELHGEALDEARKNGVPMSVLDRVQIRDFVLDPPTQTFDAIVANPPYIRHHRLPAATKAHLQQMATIHLGKPLDGRTGYHVFFLIQALTLLAPGGRLAFIMPADTCEGVFARDLWGWVSSRYRINGVVVFAPDATPFPGVDTNAVILLLENSPPAQSMKWIRCEAAETPRLRSALARLSRARGSADLQIASRTVEEAVGTGLSRPRADHLADAPRLGEIAKTVRGIATGANEFFFMTRAQAEERDLPLGLFVRAVGRTRDVQSEVLTAAHLDDLDALGTPTYLLSLGRQKLEDLPESVRAYIAEGEAKEFQMRALIRARKPWYRVEEREPPPFFFAYLGRRNARFIRNESGAVPLTGFLCVYLRDAALDADVVWQVLRESATHERLASVGKSYGGGAVKVEPRALERLPLTAPAGVEIPTRDAKGQLALVN